MIRRPSLFVLRGLLALALIVSLGAGAALAQSTYPEEIALPDGWMPEGIVTGYGPTIYAGSRATGAVYAADLRTGEGAVLVQPQAGRSAVGMSFDRRSGALFVAGGATGQAYVYDTRTGESLAAYTLSSGTPTFINDVIVTRDAAYFTNSAQAVIYRVPLGPGGELPEQEAVESIPLSGAWQQVSGFNANGIEATPSGDALIVVNSTLGTLYRVDPASGSASLIDAGGASFTNGDGLLLRGKTLYVVRNRLNQVAVVKLSRNLSRGSLVETISSPLFDVPTTIASFGQRLYVVNGRFTTPATPTTTYSIVRVP